LSIDKALAWQGAQLALRNWLTLLEAGHVNAAQARFAELHAIRPSGDGLFAHTAACIACWLVNLLLVCASVHVLQLLENEFSLDRLALLELRQL